MTFGGFPRSRTEMSRVAISVLLVVALANALQLGCSGAKTLRAHTTTMNLPRRTTLVMQEQKPEGDAASDAVAPKADTDGYETFYDDEREDAVMAAKPGISDDMRKRLINEQRGLGADPNAKNPFIFVVGGVGVFVILGALAVNM
jgi:hypothetical protein